MKKMCLVSIFSSLLAALAAAAVAVLDEVSGMPSITPEPQVGRFCPGTTRKPRQFSQQPDRRRRQRNLARTRVAVAGTEIARR